MQSNAIQKVFFCFFDFVLACKVVRFRKFCLLVLPARGCSSERFIFCFCMQGDAIWKVWSGVIRKKKEVSFCPEFTLALLANRKMRE